MCAYKGVSMTVNGTEITDLFDDNVEMHSFHFFLNSRRDTEIENLAEHSFPVGKSLLTVEGRDLARNTRECHRTVVVADREKPVWENTNVETQITLSVDEKCELTATSVLAEYEKMGFRPVATDNCAVADIVRQVKRGGAVVFDDSADSDESLHGVGEYELVYVATDSSGNRAVHTAIAELEDDAKPTGIAGCPAEDIFVEIEPSETQGHANWTLPYVSADNCLAFGGIPAPQEANGLAPGWFPVGSHPVSYALQDANANVYAKECKFTVEVKQKAHPVELTCPDPVVINTVELAGFGVPTWDLPVAMQGGKQLGAEHISYRHGAAPGMPFPYGQTSVTVLAQGAVTGERTHEDEQSDECTFTVTVKDPYRPYVDGRHFRCKEEGGAEPFGVCAGADLEVSLHPGYEDTGGYDLAGSTTRTGLACCTDQQDRAYSCKPGPGDAPLFSYCQPAA